MVMVAWKSIQAIADDILYNKNEDDIADATIIREIIGECDAVEVEAASVIIDRFQQQQVSLPYQHNPRTNFNNNSQQQQQQVVDNHCIVDNSSKINGNGRINGRHNYIAGKNATPSNNYSNNPQQQQQQQQQQVVDNHCIVVNDTKINGTGRIHDPDRHNYKTAAFFYSRADQNLTFYLTCLYNLLQKSDEESKRRATTKPIISWMPDGLSFRVFTGHHKKTAIVKLLKAHHFKFGQYQSFIQKLNLYHFQRLDTGCYTHPWFQRGRPELFANRTLHEFQQAAARNSHLPRLEVVLHEFAQAGRPRAEVVKRGETMDDTV